MEDATVAMLVEGLTVTIHMLVEELLEAMECAAVVMVEEQDYYLN